MRLGRRVRRWAYRENKRGWSEGLGLAGDEGGARLRRAPICEGGPRVATPLTLGERERREGSGDMITISVGAEFGAMVRVRL